MNQLHVDQDIGNKSDLAVVFLHGVATTSIAWKYFSEYLDARNIRVIAMDLLGFGKSPKPLGCGYSIDEHIRYVRRTLKKSDLHLPLILVGHSMGALISARYAKMYPSEIKSLFLLSPPIYDKSDVSKKSLIGFRTRYYLGLYDFLSKNKTVSKIQTSFLRNCFRIDMRVDDDNWDGFRLSTRNTIINQNSKSDILSLSCNTMVFYGNADEFIIQNNIKELTKNPRVTIRRVGFVDHVISRRYAKIVSWYLNEYLKSAQF